MEPVEANKVMAKESLIVVFYSVMLSRSNNNICGYHLFWFGVVGVELSSVLAGFVPKDLFERSLCEEFCRPARPKIE